MKFSVLISVYKLEEPVFFKTALESIYEIQTKKPDEIVIVCDGPLTDELYLVIDEFISGKENIVKVIKLDENNGLGNALNIGAQHCSYDYIMRMDSDDISDMHRFEKQISFLEKNPQIDVLGSYISEFEHSLNEPMRIRKVATENSTIIKMGKRRNPMNHVTVCMKKSALISSGSYESLLLLEDYYLWLKMIVAGYKMANIPESLVYVRVGNGFNTKRGAIDRITGWKEIQKYMLNHGLINRLTANTNMVFIRVFVHLPGVLKGFAYNSFLRHKPKKH